MKIIMLGYKSQAENVITEDNLNKQLESGDLDGLYKMIYDAEVIIYNTKNVTDMANLTLITAARYDEHTLIYGIGQTEFKPLLDITYEFYESLPECLEFIKERIVVE